jgi:hypothetical protein
VARRQTDKNAPHLSEGEQEWNMLRHPLGDDGAMNNLQRQRSSCLIRVNRWPRLPWPWAGASAWAAVQYCGRPAPASRVTRPWSLPVRAASVSMRSWTEYGDAGSAARCSVAHSGYAAMTNKKPARRRSLGGSSFDHRGRSNLIETDDGARKIPDTPCCGTESSGPRVRCRQARAPAKT